MSKPDFSAVWSLLGRTVAIVLASIGLYVGADLPTWLALVAIVVLAFFM